MREKVVETYAINPLIALAYRLPNRGSLHAQGCADVLVRVGFEFDEPNTAGLEIVRQILKLLRHQEDSVFLLRYRLKALVQETGYILKDLLFGDPDEARVDPVFDPAVEPKVEGIGGRAFSGTAKEPFGESLSSEQRG